MQWTEISSLSGFGVLGLLSTLSLCGEFFCVCIGKPRAVNTVPQLVNGDIFDMPALLLLLDVLAITKGDNLDDDFFFGIF